MKAKDIRSMTINEIEGKLAELKDKLFKQKIQKSLGQVDNPFKLKETRKDIARISTILTEKRKNDGKEK
ncbi:MAG: 50S ribosomal protein L29 [Acidobacteriota bacterium]